MKNLVAVSSFCVMLFFIAGLIVQFQANKGWDGKKKGALFGATNDPSMGQPEWIEANQSYLRSGTPSSVAEYKKRGWIR